MPTTYRLTNKKLRRIKEYAEKSLYHLNVKSADCYTFYLCSNSNWSGGWAWSCNLILSTSDYLLRLDTGKLYKIVKCNNGKTVILKLMKRWCKTND